MWFQVLDGVGIETMEQSSAKERYAGRLTPDALVDRLGHSFWQHVRELDLSRSKIRALDALYSDGFDNLRELNLDGNLLTDVHSLPRLEALRSLNLNHNCIVSSAPPESGSGLASLAQLEVLQLGFNQLTELASLRLSALPQLKVLHLQSNELTRLDGLGSLSQLRELVLDRNKIKILESSWLSGLTSLAELRVEEVIVTDYH